MRWLMVLFLAVAASAAPFHPQPTITTKGLASLKMAETADREWVPNFATGSPGGELRAFCDYQGNHYNQPSGASLTGSTLVQTYVWGTCTASFNVLPDQTLQVVGTVTNQTSVDLPNLDLNFCKIGLPTPAPGNPPTINTRFDPGYWSADGSSSTIACWFAYSDNGGWPGTMSAGQTNWGANALYARGYTLKAGESVNFRFNLNFFSTADELAQVQTKANQAYAAQYPQSHYTSDLRTIGQIFFVTGTGASGWAADHAKWATNPRGWLGDPSINIADKPAFKSRMEAFARQCVANADTIAGMRGFVIWDIEGEQYTHGPNVYVGHPSMTPELAPEMDEIADDLMTILEDGGKYEVGFCLRQQQVARESDPNKVPNWWLRKWDQPDGDASRQDLEHEILYATGRWPKTTMFYVDSNDGNEVNNYQALSNEFPALLIYPESFTVVTGMYPYWPQYQTGRPQDYVRNGLATQGKYTAVYPNAQSVINLADVANTPENVTKVTNAMVRGDIEQVRIWWTGGSEIPVIKAATADAQAKGWPKVKPTPTPSPTATPSPSPTVTPTPLPSVTPSPTPSPSVTPTPTPTPAPSATYRAWLDQLAHWIETHPAVPDK